VRKVLACLELKGLAYQIDPITPFFGDDRFAELSPLRRVPVFIDDQVTLADSSVIAQYLEERYPTGTAAAGRRGGSRPRALARGCTRIPGSRTVIVWGVFQRACSTPASGASRAISKPSHG